MFGEKQKILKSAYGEGEELSFKIPTLQIKVETVPAAKKTVSSDGVNEPGADKTKDGKGGNRPSANPGSTGAGAGRPLGGSSGFPGRRRGN